MSIDLVARVLNEGPKKGSHRLVLLAIAEHANHEGRAWPSMARIARRACMDERSARRIIRSLREAGFLLVEVGGGRGRSSRYCLRFPKNPDRETLVPEAGIGAGNPDREGPKPGPRGTETRTDGSGEPSYNPQGTVIPPCRSPTKTPLPQGWVPDAECVEYARRKCGLTDDEIAEITDDFQGYWTERTDKAARKTERGWQQAWRTWCRRAAPEFRRCRSMAGGTNSGRGGEVSGIAGAVLRRRLQH